MGTATVAAATTAVHRVTLEQQKHAADINKRERGRRASAREEEHLELTMLREEQQQLEARVRQRERAFFDKHDADKSGTLDRDELRGVLAELRPSDGRPMDEVINVLLQLVGGSAAEMGSISFGDLRPVFARYVTYLDEKQALEAFFAALDHDDSGAIELHEVQRLMSDVGMHMNPPYAPVDADLQFVYDACRTERGAPLLPGPSMLLLRPAIAEWKRMLEVRQYDVRVAENQRKKTQQSTACAVL